MGSKVRSLLQWVFFAVIIFPAVYGLRGSDLHPLAALPPNVKASLNIQEDIPSVPPTIVPAASKEHNWPRTRIGQPKGNFHQEGLTSSSPFLPSAPASMPRRLPLSTPNVPSSSTGPAPSATRSAQFISLPSPTISPASDEMRYIIPVSAPRNAIRNHLYHVNHLYKKASIAPAPTEVDKTSNRTQAPLISPASSSGYSPITSPIHHEGKQPSDITDAPLSSPSVSGSSPALSSHLPHELEPPSYAHAPMPHAESNVMFASSPSYLHPSESSPGISPVPHDVNNSPSPRHAPSSSGLQPSVSPMPHEVKQPSNISNSHLPSHRHPSESSPMRSPRPPEVKASSNTTHTHSSLPPPPTPQESPSAISPVPHEVISPSNDTHASSPKASGFTPAISAAPAEAKEPSNTTNSPLPAHPLPSGSSPAVSPAVHEVTAPSNNIYPPLASPSKPSGLSPGVSPSPHEIKDSSNVTHSPSPSRSLPSESPVISPTPHEMKGPNITHAPIASRSKPSRIAPVTSPTPHEDGNPPNVTHSPLPSYPPLSVFSPVPATPLEGRTPNSLQAPLASSPKPSVSLPAKSPTPHEINEPSNGTLSPLPSASSSKPPLSSPAVSPTTHEINEPSNGTLGPLPSASSPKPSVSSPVVSPTAHEINEPSNGILSPLPAHSLPSQSSPVASPTPPENEPSNMTQSPLPSQSHPSEYSPAVSPGPHRVKDELNATHAPLSPHHHPSVSSPPLRPIQHEAKNLSDIVLAPVPSHPYPPERLVSPASAPKISEYGARTRVGSPASAPLSPSPPSSRHPGPVISPASSHMFAATPSNKKHKHAPSPQTQGTAISPAQAPSHPPAVVPKDNHNSHAPSTHPQAPSVSPNQAPFPSANRDVAYSPSPSAIPSRPNSHAPSTHPQAPSVSPNQAPFPSANRDVAYSPSPSAIPSRPNTWPIHPPVFPPGISRKPKSPPPKAIWAFPPPPPNLDCKPLSCQDPLTYPPPGSLCVCVLPIRVGLRLGVALYTFFPLVSELAQEIAYGNFVKQSQVRVMGANAATEDPEKTIVLIDLVPLGSSFDLNTAFLIYNRFWQKQVVIKASYFGDYDVLYVLYPGLPQPPPTAPGESIDGGAIAGGENTRTLKPIGVNVRKRKANLRGSIIAVIILSSVIALAICAGALWLVLLKCRKRSIQPPPTSQQQLPPSAKPSGTGPSALRSGPSSTSASYASSIATTGSAKTFSRAEIEKATNKFHDSRIIGEGGFGRVYQGTLEDGAMVAVKVPKRDDHQGGREFLAEVEMLSRLHHRNLVKLIGICSEENVRCLVYELIPNGSVESHLHGLDKDTSPLDWNARMKIALGAARGLAYLHEDSSPRVIHRDFKSSNILLEHDFTPKVSDFGLARTALDEGNDHISTRVMGTFGYVAPEYAMTGHLLVKSDVYSYGVVLLELLTGKKPVDMSQPLGQENLVSWARPLLTSMEGLEKLIDPALGMSVSLDTVAKVAAIASMCVQPEVSHRPFMGEVVQALKLVCNESDEHIISFSQEESGQEEGRVLSESDLFCTSAAFANDVSGSFRRYSSSGPLRMGRSQNLWGRERGFSSGSMIESRGADRSGSGLEGREQWP